MPDITNDIESLLSGDDHDQATANRLMLRYLIAHTASLKEIRLDNQEVKAGIAGLATRFDTLDRRLRHLEEDETVNELKDKSDGHEERLQKLERYPPITRLLWEHPFASLAAAVLVLGFVVWLANLDPASIRAFFELF